METPDPRGGGGGTPMGAAHSGIGNELGTVRRRHFGVAEVVDAGGGIRARDVRTARRATLNDTRWIVLFEDLEELATSVRLERLPSVFGETERVASTPGR